MTASEEFVSGGTIKLNRNGIEEVIFRLYRSSEFDTRKLISNDISNNEE